MTKAKKSVNPIIAGVIIIIFLIVPGVMLNRYLDYSSDHPERNAKRYAPSKLTEADYTMWINEQFNQWSGEHLRLSEDAKNHLKFPLTYEHIETKTFQNKENRTITVKTYYSGKNAFGVPEKQCLIATYPYHHFYAAVKEPEVCF